MLKNSPSVRPLLIFAVLASGVVFHAGAAEQAGAEPSGSIYAVVHVDIEPSMVKTGVPLLKTFAKQAGNDPLVSRIEIFQQAGAPNHFSIVEVLKSQAAYEKFVEERYVKDMRARLQPLLGGPFDERLHSLLQID